MKGLSPSFTPNAMSILWIWCLEIAILYTRRAKGLPGLHDRGYCNDDSDYDNDDNNEDHFPNNDNEDDNDNNDDDCCNSNGGQDVRLTMIVMRMMMATIVLRNDNDNNDDHDDNDDEDDWDDDVEGEITPV